MNLRVPPRFGPPWMATYSAVMARLDEPLPLGYSAAGEVVRVGSGLEGGFRPGETVAMAGAELLERLNQAAQAGQLRNRGGDAVGHDQKGRETRCRFFGPLPNSRWAGGAGFGASCQFQAKGAHNRPITSSRVTPSARAAKFRAMRWRRTGFANASTSSTDGA